METVRALRRGKKKGGMSNKFFRKSLSISLIKKYAGSNPAQSNLEFILKLVIFLTNKFKNEEEILCSQV